MQIRLIYLTLLVAATSVACKSGPVTVTDPNKTVDKGGVTKIFFGGLPTGSVVAGVPVVATLGARDADDNAVAGYVGDVAFVSSDANATLPTGYSFTSNDTGSKSVTFTFKTAGAQTIKATSGSFTTGDISVTVVAADPTNLKVTGAPATAVSDATFGLTFDLRDPYGNVATGYRGTLHFSSTDANATLPANRAFTSLDAGHAVISGFALGRVSASSTITATDTATAALTATTGGVGVSAGAAKSLEVTLDSNAWVAGVNNAAKVTARDKYGAMATSFRGAISLTLQNPNTSPSSYTFTDNDAGQHTFTGLSLCSLGAHTLQATASGVTASPTVTITASSGALAKLSVNPNDKDPATPDQAATFVVSAQDVCGNPTAGGSDTLHFTSQVTGSALTGAPSPDLPADQAFPNNANSFTVAATWHATGSYDFSATSTVMTSMSGQTTVGVHEVTSIVGQLGSDNLAYTCAVIDGTQVKCWGDEMQNDAGGSGNLGLGDASPRGGSPQTVGANLPYVNLGTNGAIQSLALGYAHSCVIVNGDVKCWGSNKLGQLGLGDSSARGAGAVGQSMGSSLPTVNLGTGRTAVALGLGGNFSCAVRDDATTVCWGENEHGYLGVGDTTNRGAQPSDMGDNLQAVDLGTGRTAVALNGQLFTMCAILDDGDVKCWGRNPEGELGLGDTANRGDDPGRSVASSSPVNLGAGRTATGLASGAYHTCALLDNGQVKCWGYNGNTNDGGGQLGTDSVVWYGNGATDMANLPAVDLGQAAKRVAAGAFFSCAILMDDSVKCWGKNQYGQLGQEDTIDWSSNGTNAALANMPPIDLGTGRTAKDFTVGGDHVCAVLDNGRVRCWGYDSLQDGTLGTGAPVSATGSTVGSMGDNLLPTVLW